MSHKYVSLNFYGFAIVVEINSWEFLDGFTFF